MIFLLLAVFVAIALLWRWSAMKGRDGALAAQVAAMSREELEAEAARIRAILARHFAGEAPLAQPEAEGLAERGAWMMDRIRGMDGAQSGPAPRIRAKMELMEAAAQDGRALGTRD